MLVLALWCMYFFALSRRKVVERICCQRRQRYGQGHIWYCGLLPDGEAALSTQVKLSFFFFKPPVCRVSPGKWLPLWFIRKPIRVSRFVQWNSYSNRALEKFGVALLPLISSPLN